MESGPTLSVAPGDVSDTRHFHTMNTTDHTIELARRAVALATAQELDGNDAIRFCGEVLPALLVEIEVSRIVDERLAAMFPLPQAPAKPKAQKKTRAKSSGRKRGRPRK